MNITNTMCRLSDLTQEQMDSLVDAMPSSGFYKINDTEPFIGVKLNGTWGTWYGNSSPKIISYKEMMQLLGKTMGNQIEIEIGDIVRISDTSEYYGRGDVNPMCEGVSIPTKTDGWAYRVLWDNKEKNSYELGDLTLIKKGKTMEFTKSDLIKLAQSETVFVKYRNGDYRILLGNLLTGYGWVYLNEFNDDLLELIEGISRFDIMSVYTIASSTSISQYLKGNKLKLIWERTEQTPAQKELALLQEQITALQEQAKVLQAKL
jgi:hypothetical protein